MNHVTFDACDIQRLQHAVDYAHHACGSSLETLLPPWLPDDLKEEISATCLVSHCATLLFPASVDSALDYFKQNEWYASAAIPSVLVKRRLTERHGLPPDVDIRVTRLDVTTGCEPGPEVEVFLFPRCSPGYSTTISDSERVHGFENHVGLLLGDPGGGLLAHLANRLESDGQLVYEGSAHNPHENTTMLYFAPSSRVAGARRRFARWELQCPGDLSAQAARRPVRSHELVRAYAALQANSLSGALTATLHSPSPAGVRG
ncbi:hypothetical protein [Streptomyces sp. NPDC006879]|uniref:hypothetical protein n=1 Tax=Streptomyces sp. NPDC006879 TaxID=3364767 RepID=UPI00368DE049